MASVLPHCTQKYCWKHECSGNSRGSPWVIQRQKLLVRTLIVTIHKAYHVEIAEPLLCTCMHNQSASLILKTVSQSKLWVWRSLTLSLSIFCVANAVYWYTPDVFRIAVQNKVGISLDSHFAFASFSLFSPLSFTSSLSATSLHSPLTPERPDWSSQPLVFYI